MILLHCAGGLNRGYCFGNVFLDHSPSNVTLYFARLPLAQSWAWIIVASPHRQRILDTKLAILMS